MAEKHIAIPKPFSHGDVREWFQRFEICCKANAWDDAKKALKLPTLLEGEALAVWLELSEAEQADYKIAKEKMNSKLTPVAFVSMDEFHKRKLRPGEPLSIFVQDVKRLLLQAMPDLDQGTRNQLLLHQVIAGLPVHVGRQLRAIGETTNLDKVIERARILMTMDQQEQAAMVTEKDKEVQQLQEQITELTQQVAALTTHKQVVRCFSCNKEGHVRRDCPFQRQFKRDRRYCYNCGRQGHLERNCRQQPQGNDNGAHVPANRRPQQH